MNCRFCGKRLTHEFVDLFNAPPSNSFLTQEQLAEPELFYPLKLFVCDSCFLVQVDEHKKSGDIFNADYAYFSSYSTSWLAHAREYVEMITERLSLGGSSSVIEIASNDGYLLQYFLKKNIPCLGIEPTASTARVAREKGLDVVEDFFGQRLARTIKKADLILGNNVLAHVPDINDFVDGLKMALKPGGTITMEFPHVLKLIQFGQFDTIYHEHFSYLSLLTVERIFRSHGLSIYDVDELATHGGSLRIYACHQEGAFKTSDNVEKLLQQERQARLGDIDGYGGFQPRVDAIKLDFLKFLINAKAQGKSVTAYGAAAKGNTLLNYCGVRGDLIDFVVDASPYKRGKYLPGSHIQVVAEEELKNKKPDYIVILPWNIQDEIMAQLEYVRSWGGQFVMAIPSVKVV